VNARPVRRQAALAALILSAFLLASCGDTLEGMAILRANGLVEDGRVHDAAAIYLRAGVEDWDGVVAYDLANAFQMIGEHGSAEPLFLAAGESGSRTTAASAWFNLGVARLERGMPAEAADAFRKALESVPGDREAARAYESALAAIPDAQSGGTSERAEAGPGSPEGDPESFSLSRRSDRSLYSSGGNADPGTVDH